MSFILIKGCKVRVFVFGFGGVGIMVVYVFEKGGMVEVMIVLCFNFKVVMELGFKINFIDYGFDISWSFIYSELYGFYGICRVLLISKCSLKC